MTPFIKYLKNHHPTLGVSTEEPIKNPLSKLITPIFQTMKLWSISDPNYHFSSEDFNQLYSLLEKNIGEKTSEMKPNIFRMFLDNAINSKLSDDLILDLINYPVALHTAAYADIHREWPDLSDKVKQAVYDNPFSPNAELMLHAFRDFDNVNLKHTMKTEEIEKMMPKFFDRDYLEKTNALDNAYRFNDLIHHFFGKPSRHADSTKYEDLLKKIPLNEVFFRHAPESVQKRIASGLSPERMNQYVDALHDKASKAKTDYEVPLLPESLLTNRNFTVDHLNKIADVYKKDPHTPLLVAKHLYGKAPLENVMTGMYGAATPYFADLSSTNGEIPDAPFMMGDMPQDQFNRGYFKNPTFKIQPQHLRYGLPNWMLEKAYGATGPDTDPESARISEKSKEYLSKYANILSEIPSEQWKEILQQGPNGADKVFLRLAEWNSRAYKKIEDLDESYKSDYFGLGASGSNFMDHVNHMVHYMADHDPRSLGKLLSTLPEWAVGRIKRDFPTFGRRPANIGVINNPEVFAHITNPNVLDTLVRYGVNTSHPNFEKVKDLVDASFKRSIDNDMLTNNNLHMHISQDPESQKTLAKLLDANVFDYFSDKKAEGHVMVKRGSATLRYLRDHLEKLKQEGVDSVDPKTLPKDKTWNSILSATRHTDKQGKTTEHVAIDWNPLRDPKKGGKITQESVQKYIDSMTPKRYNVSWTEWAGDQRHSDQNSTVININLSDQHVKQLKQEGLWDSYKRIAQLLPDSHPQSTATLGWIRFTKGPNHTDPVFVDEVQSDVMKAIENSVDRNKGVAEHQAKRISEILFDGAHPSEVLHEAFQEYGRRQGWVGKPIRMHSSDSKKLMSLSMDKPVPVHFIRTYEDFPKKRLNAEPASYGEHESEQGTPFFDKTSTVDRASWASQSASEQGESEKVKKVRRIWQTEFRKTEEDLDYTDWDEDP